MSAYASDPHLNVQDLTGNGTGVDVATNLLNGLLRSLRQVLTLRPARQPSQHP
ncbi:hypothetical protein [Streptomyces sp. HD]|uniref:hypothetical protein n=1 Tax=Streptomyces sp. HD TaxID=3020892 RepID=UPI00232BBA9B|nr:hypothetical protein [Streptomyces sp. HD]MDC0769581.1 hypothetical protein [Streptomyces sp. HD]